MDLLFNMTSTENASNVNIEIPWRKIPPQNVVLRLRNRETFGARPGCHFNLARHFYRNVFPNFTVTNVEKPPCYLRKFSPTGQYFIAFSLDQTALEVYEFRGSDAAGELLQGSKSENFLAGNERYVQDVRQYLFEKFFIKKSSTILAHSGEQLNRECSLFTCDGKYVIVGAAKDLNDSRHPLTSSMFRNNEAVTGFRNHVETYTLCIVELDTGHVTDRWEFQNDKIFLSHNQGLYLYKRTLAVLGVQQQTIHIFQITDEGTFVEVRSVGRFCHEDDYLVYQQAVRVQQHQAYKEQTINSLKQRLLTHLYWRAKASGEAYTLRRFYQYFDHFLGLRMWKMQLLDEQHLLIKYASEDVVTLQIQDPNSQPSFFMVYNMETTQVLGVYENTSEELAELFEDFCDMFRNASLYYEVDYACSSSSNINARQIQQCFCQTIINAKFGGHVEATRRVLSQVPISAQSYTSSPYVDLSLFSYDDKWVSVLERPKQCGDHPIRFYCRDSGLLRFKIYTSYHRPQPSSSKRLVAFVFHPFEPFAISVQRANQSYVVNFHVRHAIT